MHFTRKTAALAASLALAGSAIVGGPAMADPTRSGLIHVVCGSDSYEVTVAGNGDWTPAHDANSNTVWQPVAFANEVAEVRAGSANGALIASFADPPSAKNGVRTGQGTRACTYSGMDGPVFDPDFGQVVVFLFSGDVWVKTKAT